jgi:hypothetical protein
MREAMLSYYIPDDEDRDVPRNVGFFYTRQIAREYFIEALRSLYHSPHTYSQLK